MDEPRTLAGRYQIQERIGTGGMGTVYRGVDIETGQWVAIKALKAEVAAYDAEGLKRFVREGEALRRLNHPNIVKMLAAVEEEKQHYLIMEYVGGGSLAQVIAEESPLPIQRVLRIALELADALTRAHHLHVIHRDIKPANILIAEDGTSRLTDFGMARTEGTTSTELTQTGMMIGTLPYLSPEACNGKKLDARADIWSFGVVLFEMLTAQRPFGEGKMAEVITAILLNPLPDLEALRPDAPLSLIDLVYRMLDKDYDSRIPSVRLVGVALEAILEGDAPEYSLGRQVQVRTLDTPSTASRRRLKHNLPAQTTPFIGRENELDELITLLNSRETRLLTILAPGGMGKTRLALEAAERIATATTSSPLQGGLFADGVYFVPLASYSNLNDIITAAAEAIGYAIQADRREPLQQLLDYLHERKLLLILDNFEHLLAGAEYVTRLLEVAPNIKVLTTSRERLNLHNETLFRIEGFDPPNVTSLEAALQNSAVQLFVHSARRVRPGYELTQPDVIHVAAICRLVQGLPLGIVLAATWVELLTPQEIVMEMGKSLDFLESGMRDLPERHRSIRAVFDYSWKLLQDGERDTLLKLAHFAGGFTLEASQAVAESGLRTLVGLVNKSLLRRDPTGRYHIHQLLRQYTNEMLQHNPAVRKEAGERHAAYFAKFIARHEAALKGGDQVNALKELDRELENIRVMWQWVVAGRDVKTARIALEGLGFYYEMTSRLDEGLRTVHDAAVAFRAQDRVFYGFILTWQGFFEYHLAHYERAAEIQSTALDIANQTGDNRLLADAARGLGYALYPVGKIEEARQHLHNSLSLAYLAGDQWRVADAWKALTYTAVRSGDFANWKQYNEKAVAEYRAMGDAIHIIEALTLMGTVTHMLGEYDAAKRYYGECLALAELADNRSGSAYALYNLGLLYWSLDELNEAENADRKSLNIYRELGNRGGMAWAMIQLGMVMTSQGNLLEAESLLNESLKLHEESGNQFALVWALKSLGVLALARGQVATAREFIMEALRRAHELGDLTAQAFLVLEMAEVLQREDQPEKAVRVMASAMASPANGKPFGDRKMPLKAALEAQLGAEPFAAAWTRGSAEDLSATVNALLA